MEHPIGRRGFLKMMGAAATVQCVRAASSNDVTAPGRFPPWELRLSTSSIHFAELPLEAACERIAHLGFEAIDIWSAYQGCPHLDDVASRLGAAGVRDLLDRHRLKLCAFSVYAGGYTRYAELLGKVGGGVAIQGSAPAGKPEELKTRMRGFLDSLKPLLDLAEQNNSYLAIENHRGALLNSLDSFRAFVDANRSGRLGIALAPYHLQAAKASVSDAIRICGKQLFFFYAWQQQAGVKQLPGVGPTDMTPWLSALAEVGYHGYVNAFMHGHPGTEVMAASLATARDYLKDRYVQSRKAAPI